MGPVAVDLLREALRRLGPVIASDADSCRGVLADLGMERGPASALEAAVACGAAGELASSSVGEAAADRAERLSRQVHEHMAIEVDAARWAVSAWAAVLSPPAIVALSPPATVALSPPATAALRTGPPGARSDYVVGPGQVRSGGQGALFEAVLCSDRLGSDLFGCRVGLKQLTGITRERWQKIQLRSRRLAAVRHPGLVQHLETFEGPAPCVSLPAEDECDLFYSAHVWVEGSAMSSVVGDGCEPAEALLWFRQVAETLDFLHDQDEPIVHRDLHPGNVVITPDGRAVVIDYETALPHLDAASTNLAAGAVGFIPPEPGADREAPGDRWQLGMISAYALLGHPQGALTSAQLSERLAEKLAGRVLRPATAVDQIMTMLAADPSARPPRCTPWVTDLAASLGPARRGRLLLPTRKQTGAPTGHRQGDGFWRSRAGPASSAKRRRVAGAAAIVASVVLIGGGVFAFASARDPGQSSRDPGAVVDAGPTGDRGTGGPCGEEASVLAYYRSSVAGDPVAGAALGAEWASRDPSNVGCPDLSRGPSRLGNFWVSSLTQSAAGPTLVVVPDDRSDSRRLASVVFPTARRYFLDNADILRVAENRRSFGPGDLQVFQFEKGECSALSRLGSDPDAALMPAAVFDIAVRAAQPDRGVPFVADQRQVQDRRVFTVKFASAVTPLAASAPVVTVDALAPVDVTLRSDGTATGAARRSDGRSCPVDAIRSMDAIAKTLATLSPPAP